MTRVLHVVGGLARGGIETWLMGIFRSHDDLSVQFEVLSTNRGSDAYDDEVVALGIPLHKLGGHRNPLRFSWDFHRFLKEHGPYDIVHSHAKHYSGVILSVAWMAGVKRRIAHSHNDVRPVLASAGWKRRLYVGLTNLLIRALATQGLACSDAAARSLFGEDYRSDPRWRVLLYGVPMVDQLVHPRDPILRDVFGLPRDATVVGHVGRFVAQKNHPFLFECFAAFQRRDPSAHLMLFGDGVVRPELREKVEGLGIVDSVHFMGTHSEIPRLMTGLFDLLALPSLFEGLGLVVVEAQAAGLPTIVSEFIPPEAVVLPDLVTTVKLSSGIEAWAEAMEAVIARPRPSPEESLEAMRRSCFSLTRSLEELLDVYTNQMATLSQ